MEKGRTFETVVGLFVLVVAVFFFSYVYQKSGWVKSDGITLTARFDRADGLTEGTDVKISGVRVGKVLTTSVDPENFMAVVTFYVSANIKLPKDSSASVLSDGLFGGRYLAIIPGGEDENLQEGDSIENTTGPINIESLISNFVFSKDKKEETK
ncbi:MAG: outer membrane lipid asymmetry maintenance protein MlaD [Alphaproteobacteria bacterium]|nr:outer membrane lipid asymmetry maintenance protein MlaD [Alphaproteobacteria bacterium]